MRKTRKPKKPLTVRSVRIYYEKLLHDLKQELIETQHKLAGYVRAERRREQDKEMQWEAFDHCNDEVTRQERALFEASPAYKKYQLWRGDYEIRGTDDWRLKVGDWRAP